MKPGYRTSEFWAMLAGTALVNFGPAAQAIADASGPKTSLWTTAILGGLYTLSRGLAKAGTGQGG